MPLNGDPHRTRYFSQLLCAFLLLLHSASASANESVVLQLKWQHSFQFAGYYAAQWQGYYEQEGLDVTIQPAIPSEFSSRSIPEIIREGEIDFAIGSSDVLLSKDAGYNPVILAPMFQRDPMALISKPEVIVERIEDLVGKRIVTLPGSIGRVEITAMLRLNKIPIDAVTFIDAVPSVRLLQQDKADIVVTYATTGQINAELQQIAVNTVPLTTIGLNLYGDVLYTLKKVADSDPEKVRRFVRASKKGWDYALRNKQEIIDRISREYSGTAEQQIYLQVYNSAIAGQIDELMNQPMTQIGDNDPQRWQHIITSLKKAGVLKGDWQVDSLFFKPVAVGQNYVLVWVGLGLVSALILVVAFLPSFQGRNIWWLISLIIVMAIGVEYVLEKDLSDRHKAEISSKVRQHVGALASKLNSEVKGSLSLLQGIAAHIAVNSEVNQQKFAAYVSTFSNDSNLFMHVTAAPDMVIRYAHPLAGREDIIGLDFNKIKKQRQAAWKVRDSGKSTVAGPLQLVQGPTALIVRTPVFTEDGSGQKQFWGLISGPILIDRLYERVGLLDSNGDIEVAIRGRNATGAKGDVFFGDTQVFADDASVKQSVAITSGSWQIAARPRMGWELPQTTVWTVRATALLMSLALLIVFLLKRRQQQSKQAYENKLEDNQSLLTEVGELARISGWKVDENGNLVYWGEMAETITGIAADSSAPVDQLLENWCDNSAGTLFVNSFDKAIQRGIPLDLELKNKQDGGVKWIRLIGKPAPTSNGRFTITGAVQDISERKAFTETIERQANFDGLTGLPNRAMFTRRLHQLIEQTKQQQSKLAILFVDLDNFKPVNDRFGHAAGDILLSLVAQRISACVRTQDMVARYSGDEFTVIVNGYDQYNYPSMLAERILAQMSQVFNIDSKVVVCSASIGVSCFPEHGDNVDELLSFADMAMYDVKHDGRNGYRVFNQEMLLKNQQSQQYQIMLKQAILDGELDVFLQPIIDTDSGLVVKCEALVRWFDAEGKMHPTEQFVTVAEESGLIHHIDLFVLQQAGRLLIEYKQQQGKTIGLSVNVSPRVFSLDEFSLQQWLSALADIAAQIPVTVEITERLLTVDTDKAIGILNKIHQCHATIAIDDFGTGYSSLSYLIRFPIDLLKIDRSFTQNIGYDIAAETLTDTILGLADKLSLQVIAEGVETQHQLDYLRQRQCDYVQGYFTGKPMPGNEFFALVAAQNKPAPLCISDS